MRSARHCSVKKSQARRKSSIRVNSDECRDREWSRMQKWYADVGDAHSCNRSRHLCADAPHTKFVSGSPIPGNASTNVIDDPHIAPVVVIVVAPFAAVVIDNASVDVVVVVEWGWRVAEGTRMVQRPFGV